MLFLDVTGRLYELLSGLKLGGIHRFLLALMLLLTEGFTLV
jgi:hypothetical protein